MVRVDGASGGCEWRVRLALWHKGMAACAKARTHTPSREEAHLDGKRDVRLRIAAPAEGGVHDSHCDLKIFQIDAVAGQGGLKGEYSPCRLHFGNTSV